MKEINLKVNDWVSKEMIINLLRSQCEAILVKKYYLEVK